MGGTSTSTGKTDSTSQLTGYAPAMSGLNSIINSLSPSIGNINGGPDVQNAIGQLESNAQQPNTLGSGAINAVSSLLGGGLNIGGAIGLLNGGYNAAANALSPYTSGNALDPSSNPALASQLATVNQDVTNTVNPMFAAAGRLGSPDNYQALARGITQGSAPILQNAAGNQIAAAGQLGNLGTSTASGLTNADVANAGILGSGVNNASTAFNANNLGPQQYLTAALLGDQLPIQNAGALSGILGPLAAQFGTQTGSGTQSGTQQMSGAQQFATIMGGLGSLFGGRKA